MPWKYNFDITNTTCNPDGHGSRTCLLINNQYPGPVVSGSWGDTVRITVTNHMQNNGTEIHWHGLRQLGTNPMDGTNGITSCKSFVNKHLTHLMASARPDRPWFIEDVQLPAHAAWHILVSQPLLCAVGRRCVWTHCSPRPSYGRL